MWQIIEDVNGDNSKLFYMDTDSFIVYVKSEDVYEDLAGVLSKDLAGQPTKSKDHYPKEKAKR